MMQIRQMPVALIAAAHLSVALAGCVSFRQDTSEVLVRDPGADRYGDPTDATASARRHWEYASMSDRAYEFARALSPKADMTVAAAADPGKPTACGPIDQPPRPKDFEPWDSFPSADLSKLMGDNGLFLWVAERQRSPREIAVVFEGTNFSELPDWTANLRWFLRFIPGFEDQYTLTARLVAKEFRDRLASRPDSYRLNPNDVVLRHAGGEPIKIVSAGHSLGGGLAQHFAYTFVQSPEDAKGPRVAEVYAFDPSPVTGWFTANDPPRAHNATALRTNRIFEHGEVLAYIRLFTSRWFRSKEDPAIWEYRYNFDPKLNIIRNHSIRSLACGLYFAAQEAK